MHPYLPLSVSPYPNLALSGGQLALIALVSVLTLAAWLILVFGADRQQRHRSAARMTSPPPQQQLPALEQEREQPERKAA